MAEQAGTVVWTIEANTDELQKGIKTAKELVSSFSDGTDKADKASSSFNRTLSNLSTSFSTVEKQASVASGKQEEFAISSELMSKTAVKSTAEYVEASNQLGEELNKLTDEMFGTSYATENMASASGGAKDGITDIGEEAEKTSTKVLTLKDAVGALLTGAIALKAIRFIVSELKETITQANETNRVLTQTNSIINATGQVAGVTAEQVNKMAKQIQATTSIQDEHAQAGMNVLLQYTRIGEEVFPQATQAMIDMATAIEGGIPSASQLESVARQVGSALNDPIQGMGRLTRAGITFTEAEKDKVKALVESGRTLEAQNIILDRLTVFTGSAEAQSKTFEGQMNALKGTLNDIRADIGNALAPTLGYLADIFKQVAGQGGVLISVIRAISTAFATLITAGRSLGIVLSTIFASIWSAFTGDFRGAVQVIEIGLSDLKNEFKRAGETITGIWSDEVNTQVGYTNEGFENIELASGKKAQKIIDDLAKETEAYREATAKRQLQFERALADLVWAHQDKVKNLQEDLNQENASYKEAVAKRTQEFHKSMADMEQSHLKKVESIEKQLAREIRKQEDKVAEVLALGKKQLDEEEKEHAKRIAIIESQIENELAKGEWASEEVLETLRRRLANEEFIHQEKVDEIKDQIDDETDKAVSANQHRIDDLEDRLKDEVERNDKAINEKIAKYEEETLALEQQHNTRVSNIRTTLEEELGILEAHQDSVDKVKDQAKLDDIARLKRQFEEQSAEEEKNHQARLARIREEGTQAGQTSGTNFNAGLAGVAPTIAQTSANIGRTINREMVNNASQNSYNDGRSIGQRFMDGIRDRVDSLKSSLRYVINSIFSGFQMPSFSLFGGGGGGGGGGFAFADGVRNFGGGLALVGERGPEIVNLPRGSDVIPNEVAFGESGFGGGGSAIVNIGNVYEKSDVDMITRELGFKSSLMH